MIIAILSAIILARVKKYNVKLLFKAWAFYPIIFFECIHIFYQINIFLGNYYYIQYAVVIRTFYLFAFFVPMFRYKLYKPALIGSASICIGSMMNRFVMFQNGGKMPVFGTLSYITGYIKTYTFDVIRDIHILGDPNTRFKFLTDYIDVGFSIYSLGDVFIHSFAFIMVYSTIKALNKETNINCTI